MRLHFSNVNFSSRTGPNTFGTRLADCLARRGHEIVDHNKDYDIFLCFIEPTTRPRPGSKFIQRLDGIWFKPENYISHNQGIKQAYYYSDHVIWQSEFDKNMIENFWGPKKGTIIHNGISLNSIAISPEIKSIREKYQRVFTCSANWHRQKRLKENIQLFQKIASDKDVLLVLGSNWDYVTDDKRIVYLGNQPHNTCLQLYAISDWFIHLAWLDHCPNVVVEALSQNCPVICTDSGGTHEIVRNNGLIVKETQKYQFQLCDYDNPPCLDINVILNDKISVDPHYLDIELVADKYEKVFQFSLL